LPQTLEQGIWLPVLGAENFLGAQPLEIGAERRNSLTRRYAIRFAGTASATSSGASGFEGQQPKW